MHENGKFFSHVGSCGNRNSQLCIDCDGAGETAERASDRFEARGLVRSHGSVLHRLRQAKILKSVRGPAGGFLLMKEPGMIRTLEVFEALEGKVEDRYCLFLNSKCEGRCALFGEITSLVNRQAREFFGRLSLEELAREDGGCRK